MAPDVNVWFRGKWYGPSYPDAGDLPAGRASSNDTDRAEQVLTSSQADAFSAAAAAMAPPPKAGPGSSKAKWAAYAAAHNVDVPDGADRDDIIAALRNADVPVDQPDD